MIGVCFVYVTCRHSIYSFVRKKDYFEKIGDIINSYDLNFNDDVMFLRMKKIIFAQNMNQLALTLQTINNREVYFILKYKNELMSLFNQNKWQNGLKLFQLVLKRHDQISKP